MMDLEFLFLFQNYRRESLNMRVLLIDDDKLVCISLKTILETEEDIEVVGCGFSGNDAIELYDKLNPDILLMDIRMKGVTGIEAAETILTKHKDAKILFLTTFSDDEYIVKALKIGAKGYIIQRIINDTTVTPKIQKADTYYYDEIENKYLLEDIKKYGKQIY